VPRPVQSHPALEGARASGLVGRTRQYDKAPGLSKGTDLPSAGPAWKILSL
jgi:hypothetical protein